MSSNSIRVTASLFQAAQTQGELLTRSAAQQVEHWARLGAALEYSGLTVDEALGVMRGALRPAQAAQVKKTRKSAQTPTAGSSKTVVMSEADMWAFKRAQQARDVKDVESGNVSGRSMGWFSKRLMKQVTLIDAPY
ncbi:MAG: hypothetical protein ABW220_01735 [Burkholderiaceae bacterium]